MPRCTVSLGLARSVMVSPPPSMRHGAVPTPSLEVSPNAGVCRGRIEDLQPPCKVRRVVTPEQSKPDKPKPEDLQPPGEVPRVVAPVQVESEKPSGSKRVPARDEVGPAQASASERVAHQLIVEGDLVKCQRNNCKLSCHKKNLYAYKPGGKKEKTCPVLEGKKVCGDAGAVAKAAAKTQTEKRAFTFQHLPVVCFPCQNL